MKSKYHNLHHKTSINLLQMSTWTFSIKETQPPKKGQAHGLGGLWDLGWDNKKLKKLNETVKNFG